MIGSSACSTRFRFVCQITRPVRREFIAAPDAAG
jgi:hypothetical protein